MATIKFKATRRKHDSGFTILKKEGALQFDQDQHSLDVIVLYPKRGGRIAIDHIDGYFKLHFNEKEFERNNDV
ncbi:hypothetical protein M0R04_06605 [Candidatus Dojkabacteria bacterium]|jgi:hypothetical protein|nr:hypothetical protein [Candidatus Dojkabacteria bacterium]